MLIEKLDYRLVEGKGSDPIKRKYRLLRDYFFTHRNETYMIPAGYAWDGPTLVPFTETINSDWVEPSLVHDYIYEFQGKIGKNHLTRWEADHIFFQMLRDKGVWEFYIFCVRYFLRDAFKEAWVTDGEPASPTMKRLVPVIKLLFIVGFFIFIGGVSFLLGLLPVIGL